MSTFTQFQCFFSGRRARSWVAGGCRCNCRHERPVGREIRSAVGTVCVLYEDKWSASSAACRKLIYRRSRVTEHVSIV